jgi:TetR/AcrR family fatty acid metabolism transcriptional regulator
MSRLSAAARRELVEERKLQILKAASRVFARKGFERATVSAVAREAGLAEGSIYNYFKNKDDLLASIPHLMVVPAVQPLVLEPDAPVPPAEQALQALAHNIVAAIRQNADVVRVVLSALPSMSAKSRRIYLEQTPFYALSILEGFVVSQIKAGKFRADLDPVLAARIFPGMLFAFLLLQEIIVTDHSEQLDYDAIVEHVVAVYLHGVMRPSPLNPPAGKPRRRRKAT